MCEVALGAVATSVVSLRNCGTGSVLEDGLTSKLLRLAGLL